MGLTVVLAACSGDDDTTPAGDDDGGADAPALSDGVGTGDGDAPALILSEVAATGDALFPCLGDAGAGSLEILYVQQLPVETVGPLAEAFRGAVGDYQRRCGGVGAGAIEVAVGYRDGENEVCELGQLAGAVVVVTDAADDAAAACLGSSSRLVWHEGGAADPSTTAGTSAPLAVRASRSVAAALAEGVVDDRSVVVLHDGSDRSVGAVEGGVLPRLEASSVEVETVVAACEGNGVGGDLDGRFVVTILPPPCLVQVVDAAAGADVRWLIVEDNLSLAPVEGLAFDDSAFDSALAYEFAPTIVGGLPRDRAPVARDRACVEFLDGFTGSRTAFPSAAFTAHARLCSTIAGLIAALDAAGDDVSPDAIREAIPGSSSALVLSQGQRRGAGDDSWLAPALVTTIEWNADCDCWTYVRGPDLASVD